MREIPRYARKHRINRTLLAFYHLPTPTDREGLTKAINLCPANVYRKCFMQVNCSSLSNPALASGRGKPEGGQGWAAPPIPFPMQASVRACRNVSAGLLACSLLLLLVAPASLAEPDVQGTFPSFTQATDGSLLGSEPVHVDGKHSSRPTGRAPGALAVLQCCDAA